MPHAVHSDIDAHPATNMNGGVGPNNTPYGGSGTMAPPATPPQHIQRQPAFPSEIADGTVLQYGQHHLPINSQDEKTNRSTQKPYGGPSLSEMEPCLHAGFRGASCDACASYSCW